MLSTVFFCSCHKPIAVIHCARPDIHYVTKKGYGYPKHYFYSRLLCFDKACRKKSAWIKEQKHKAVHVKIKKTFRKKTPPCCNPKTLPEKEEDTKPDAGVRPSLE